MDDFIYTIGQYFKVPPERFKANVEQGASALMGGKEVHIMCDENAMLMAEAIKRAAVDAYRKRYEESISITIEKSTVKVKINPRP